MSTLILNLKKLLAIAICLLVSMSMFAQEVTNETTADTSVEKQAQPTQLPLYYKNGGVWQDGVKISPELARRVLSGNSEALYRYSSGRSLYVVGQIITIPCVLVIVYGVILLANDEKNGESLLGIGAAGTAVGILLSAIGENQIKTAVKIYNSKSNNTVFNQINFGFTQNGVGLSMKF